MYVRSVRIRVAEASIEGITVNVLLRICLINVFLSSSHLHRLFPFISVRNATSAFFMSLTFPIVIGVDLVLFRDYIFSVNDRVQFHPVFIFFDTVGCRRCLECELTCSFTKMGVDLSKPSVVSFRPLSFLFVCQRRITLASLNKVRFLILPCCSSRRDFGIRFGESVSFISSPSTSPMTITAISGPASIGTPLISRLLEG